MSRLDVVLAEFRTLIAMSRSGDIARRYFVTNGFDGTLAMLGLTLGISAAETVELQNLLNACMGAAIALAVSGFSSAYVSELAERRKSLQELEDAMLSDLSESDHGLATRLAPLFIGLVNGLSPFLMAMIVMSPMWLDAAGVHLPWASVHVSTATAFALIVLLGAYLGRVSGTFWFTSCLRTFVIALVTAALILIFRLD